nr:hypothetical protein [Sphingomonas populi]
MKMTRKRYTGDFKAKAALEAIRGDLSAMRSGRTVASALGTAIICLLFVL